MVLCLFLNKEGIFWIAKISVLIPYYFSYVKQASLDPFVFLFVCKNNKKNVDPCQKKLKKKYLISSCANKAIKNVK